MQYLTVHGVDIPSLGMGTARMRGSTCRDAVTRALELGYRHIDTAQMYGNEEAVGAGIEATDVARGSVFMTTKIDRQNMRYDDVHSSVSKSLDRLGLDAIDLLLIHAPSSAVPLDETIRAMNEVQADGAVRHIGVSNFSVEQTREAQALSETPIITNQVKYHPYYEQRALLEFCIETSVMLTAYTPLAKGTVADDDVLGAIGERYGKTGAQVALRWLVQQPNVCAIPKAADERHLAENLDVFDFELTAAEMGRVFDLQGGLADRLRNLLRL